MQIQGTASGVAVSIRGLHIHINRSAVVGQGKGQCAVIIGNLNIAIAGGPGLSRGHMGEVAAVPHPGDRMICSGRAALVSHKLDGLVGHGSGIIPIVGTKVHAGFIGMALHNRYGRYIIHYRNRQRAVALVASGVGNNYGNLVGDRICTL